MNKYFENKGKRSDAYNKLMKFLVNPGRFSLTVLGDRGVGKKFAIKSVYKEIKSNTNNKECIKELEFIDASDIPETKAEIDELLERCNQSILVIEDVENLNTVQQKLLFTAMQTNDGTFGIEEKKYEVRMVFTSSESIEQLRTSNQQLQGYFWDRISQLIVYFPNFIEEGNFIVPDFKSIWSKMNFENIVEYKHLSKTPQSTRLESFLENNKETFEGNYRDLDKLAIMYFNYRIFFYEGANKISEEIEKKVLEAVKNDFLQKSQLKNPTYSDLSYFQIREGFSMEELKSQFRNRVKEWGRNKYKTIAQAERKLGLGRGTMKNY